LLPCSLPSLSCPFFLRSFFSWSWPRELPFVSLGNRAFLCWFLSSPFSFSPPPPHRTLLIMPCHVFLSLRSGICHALSKRVLLPLFLPQSRPGPPPHPKQYESAFLLPDRSNLAPCEQQPSWRTLGFFPAFSPPPIILSPFAFFILLHQRELPCIFVPKKGSLSETHQPLPLLNFFFLSPLSLSRSLVGDCIPCKFCRLDLSRISVAFFQLF